MLVALSMVLKLLGMSWGAENVKAEEPGSEPVKYLYYEWDDDKKCLIRNEGTATGYEKIESSETEITIGGTGSGKCVLRGEGY